MAMLLDNEARWLIRTDENIQKAYTNVALPYTVVAAVAILLYLFIRIFM